MEAVPLYFDFISPYSWLALTEAGEFARQHRIRWELHPVVYAALLDAHGLLGPAEVPAKRRYAFRDVRRGAELLGVEMTGPPEHPFRSLKALRVACLFRDEENGLPLAAALAHAAWGEGRDLTDAAVLADVVAAQGLDARDLSARIAAPENKERLRAGTAAAIDLGVFGVPTFAFGGDLFWGHDRMAHLAAALEGRVEPRSVADDELLARPRGTDRKRAGGG